MALADYPGPPRPHRPACAALVVPIRLRASPRLPTLASRPAAWPTPSPATPHTPPLPATRFGGTGPMKHRCAPGRYLVSSPPPRSVHGLTHACWALGWSCHFARLALILPTFRRSPPHKRVQRPLRPPGRVCLNVPHHMLPTAVFKRVEEQGGLLPPYNQLAYWVPVENELGHLGGPLGEHSARALPPGNVVGAGAVGGVPPLPLKSGDQVERAGVDGGARADTEGLRPRQRPGVPIHPVYVTRRVQIQVHPPRRAVPRHRGRVSH
mmetsp:Transcript_124620/g.285443  ORF Transcript_124620/g.285443 Transcript_124620/m.285443 type:complete len:266 (-) Transcript_124620:148-945(-)